MNNYEGILLLIERKKYDLAISKLKEMLSSNPEDSTIYFLLSVCHTEQKKYSEGRNYIEKALKLDPKSSTNLNQYAEIEIEEKNYRAGQEILNQSLTIAPRQEEAFLIKARIYFEQGNLNRSVEYAKKALAIEPNNNFPKNIIALVLIIQKQYTEANEIVTQALRADPTDTFSLYNLGLIKLFNDEIQESKEILKDALSKDPDNEFLREGLKQVIVSRNKLAHLFLKLSVFTDKHEKIFRNSIATIHRLVIVIGGLGYYVSQGPEGGDFSPFLVIILLSIYDIQLILYRIVPQIFTLNLYFDPIGKYLITRRDIQIILLTLISFVIGISFLVRYFNFPTEAFNYILIAGLSFIFLSGVLVDIGEEMEEAKGRTTLFYFIWLLSLVLIYLSVADSRSVIIVFMFISLLVYPYVVSSIRDK